MRRPITLLFAATLAMTHAAAAADPLSTLAGSEWGFPQGGDNYIQFREDGVSGFFGCNRFTGSYTFADGKLSIGPLAGTRMACEPDKMETERAILALLDAAKAADATHKTLILKDAAGATIATLTRRDWD